MNLTCALPTPQDATDAPQMSSIAASLYYTRQILTSDSSIMISTGCESIGIHKYAMIEY